MICPNCGNSVNEMNICHIRNGGMVCRDCCGECPHHKEYNACGYVKPDPTLKLREKVGPLNAEIYHLELDADRLYKRNKPKEAEKCLSRINYLKSQVKRIEDDWYEKHKNISNDNTVGITPYNIEHRNNTGRTSSEGRNSN